MTFLSVLINMSTKAYSSGVPPDTYFHSSKPPFHCQMFGGVAATLALGWVSAGTLALGILCPLLWIGTYVSDYFDKHFFSLMCGQSGCHMLYGEGGQGCHAGDGD